MYAILPFATFLWLTGVIWLKFREFLHRVLCRRLGVREPSQRADPRKLIGKLLLEGTQLVQFVGKFKKDGKTIGTYVWTDMPMLDGNGTYRLAKIMTIELDLREKRFEKGTLDGEDLAARDALILIWFHVIFANHVKIHSYANWATNAQEHKYDPFLHRMSVTTIMYNFFGFSAFPTICGYWKSWGIASDFHNITEVIKKGISNGIPHHAGLGELIPYSDIAKFIIPLRKHFHSTFKEHQDEFPGIDPESFFIGTIMHSLDHTLMGWNLTDPMFLDTSRCDPRFRIMAELGRFVRAGFVDDLPGLPFRKNYYNAPGKFYKRIYTFAARLNKKLADAMDVCIIK